MLLVIALLVFLWAPTEGTQRLAPSILLLVLLIAGFEAMRRKTVGDFPDESWQTAGARWSERFAGLRRSVSSRGESAAPADPGEERIRQLERLEGLRESGVLDDDELAAEKQRILGDR